MKYDLVKLHHWLLVSTFKSKWFEENIKLEIISILSWIIYPEYRKSVNLLKLIRSNKIILVSMIISIIWTLGFFSFGKILSIKEITYKYIFVDKPEKKIHKKNIDHKRILLEKFIKSECSITHTDNLSNLPDSIFTAMIEEINKNEIPPEIFFGVADHESGFLFIENYTGSGAMGYYQIMPGTFNSVKHNVGVIKHDKISNIKVASYLLKTRYVYYKKSGMDENSSWYYSLKDYAGGGEELPKSILRK